MASFIRNMTQVGGGSRQIARLLQAKAPPNHILAYITPEEANLLEARGGSGREDPNTGIPTFEVEEPPIDMVAPPTEMGGAAADTTGAFDYGAGGETYSPFVDYGFGTLNQPLQAPPVLNELGQPAVLEAPQPLRAETGLREPTAADRAGPQPGGDDFLKRLALAGVTGLFGARQARAAQKQGQAAAEEQRALGRPYQEQGRQLQAAAQRGELSPVAQQSLQALRARMAQGAQARGGVGAQQAMQQMEAFRNQLLQQQFDFGLKLSQIGDQYAMGAIKTGLQADQYVNSLTNSFFTNMARTLFAQQPAQQPRPPGG
jgi:hypothetical protein